MKISSKYSPGDSVFLRNDYDQLEYVVTAVLGRYGAQIFLELHGPAGDFIEVHETSVTSEQDVVKKTSG